MVVVVAFGTIGLVTIEAEWGWWDAFFFTLITITTVGYGDYGLSPAGERFTGVLMIAGIATITYAAGQFVRGIVAYQLNWKLKMQHRIDTLRDHYIICGCGRVGRVICNTLQGAGHDFVAIESDERRVEALRQSGVVVLAGNATDDQVLWKAGIGRAKGLVCASDDDIANIVATLSARDLNPGIRIICRANGEDALHKLRRAGADSIIAPALESGRTIANMLTQPNLADFLASSHVTENGFALNEVVVAAGSVIEDMTFREYGESHPNLVYLALKRPGETEPRRPSGDDRFQAGDVVIVASVAAEVAEITNDAAEPARGGSTGFVAARPLQREEQHIADALAAGE